MGADLGNFGGLDDYTNAKDAWIGSSGKSHRLVLYYAFQEYTSSGSAIPDEKFRQIVYATKKTHIWLAFIKPQDTTVGGRFTTGDLDINSEFQLQGYQAPTTLPDGTVVPGRGSDLVGWNGKLWEVADVLEPIQWGYQEAQVFYHTVMRHSSLASSQILLKQ